MTGAELEQISDKELGNRGKALTLPRMPMKTSAIRAKFSTKDSKGANFVLAEFACKLLEFSLKCVAFLLIK